MTPYKEKAHKGRGKGMRLTPTCQGCPEASLVVYARQMLAAAHPEWTLMRIHDRAIVTAVKMRDDGFPRIYQGG